MCQPSGRDSKIFCIVFDSNKTETFLQRGFSRRTTSHEWVENKATFRGDEPTQPPHKICWFDRRVCIARCRSILNLAQSRSVGELRTRISESFISVLSGCLRAIKEPGGRAFVPIRLKHFACPILTIADTFGLRIFFCKRPTLFCFRKTGQYSFAPVVE
uniref:Uncharacterized protein n=1 Tax=Leptospirillum ferriphilum TaxID=178606 RepID=A0A2I2MFE8_9BACT